MSKKVPILFIIFNRPETEIQVFNRIREYQPDKLYVAADGPRKGKAGEDEKCREARAIIQGVDWPCEVKTLFREENLGCGPGVSSAITWFFQQEEYGCIIEDDVLPALDFFQFCEDALPRYKSCDKVFLISSFNPVSPIKSSSTLGFNRYANIWGWASWRRAWGLYDLEMKRPVEMTLPRWIQFYGVFLGSYMFYSCRKLARSHQRTGKWHTWDSQWNFTVFINNGLALAPYVNLTKNVGIGVGDGTHYAADTVDPFQSCTVGRLLPEYNYPNGFFADKQLTRWMRRQVFLERWFGVRTRIRRLIRSR